MVQLCPSPTRTNLPTFRQEISMYGTIRLLPGSLTVRPSECPTSQIKNMHEKTVSFLHSLKCYSPKKTASLFSECIILIDLQIPNSMESQSANGDSQRPQHRTRHSKTSWKTCWLVVSTHLKNISQNGNLPQIGMNMFKQIFETTT